MLFFLSALWASPWNPEEGEVARLLLSLHDEEKWAEVTPQARAYVRGQRQQR